MEDLEIINQLYNGNHLEKKELERASILLKQLEISLSNRIETEFLRK